MNNFTVAEVPGKGRIMLAAKNFAVGDIIFEEEPFAAAQLSWNAAYGYAACDHCLRPLETTTENIRRLANDATLDVPLLQYCPTARWLQQFTSCMRCKVRYCSEDCRMDAYHKYHRVGCLGMERLNTAHPINLLNEIWKRMHYPPETGTILLIVRLMAMYKQSSNKPQFLETLQDFQALTVNREQNIYHKILGPNFEKQLEELYGAFCNAYGDEEYAIFTTPDAFKSLMALIGTNSQGFATSPLAQWTKNVTELKLPAEDKAKLESTIDDLYQKVCEFAGNFLNNEGVGLYSLQSKINHSCVPNAESTFPYSNNIVVLQAIKPIAVGEEICISYLDECQLSRSRHSRQKELKENYIFLCECLKCKEQAQDPDVTSDEDEDDDDEDDAMDTGDDM